MPPMTESKRARKNKLRTANLRFHKFWGMLVQTREYEADPDRYDELKSQAVLFGGAEETTRKKHMAKYKLFSSFPHLHQIVFRTGSENTIRHERSLEEQIARRKQRSQEYHLFKTFWENVGRTDKYRRNSSHFDKMRARAMQHGGNYSRVDGVDERRMAKDELYRMFPNCQPKKLQDIIKARNQDNSGTEQGQRRGRSNRTSHAASIATSAVSHKAASRSTSIAKDRIKGNVARKRKMETTRRGDAMSKSQSVVTARTRSKQDSGGNDHEGRKAKKRRTTTETNTREEPEEDSHDDFDPYYEEEQRRVRRRGYNIEKHRFRRFWKRVLKSAKYKENPRRYNELKANASFIGGGAAVQRRRDAKAALYSLFPQQVGTHSAYVEDSVAAVPISSRSGRQDSRLNRGRTDQVGRISSSVAAAAASSEDDSDSDDEDVAELLTAQYRMYRQERSSMQYFMKNITRILASTQDDGISIQALESMSSRKIATFVSKHLVGVELESKVYMGILKMFTKGLDDNEGVRRVSAHTLSYTYE